jgi:KUP system potassium uptake protein
MARGGLGYEARFPPMSTSSTSSDSGSSHALPTLNAHGKAAAPSLAKVVTALGIVYGDIGTSPLYALKECVSGPHGVAPTPANVLGLCSLIFWSLSLVVVLKYLIFVLRADNNGEGGVLALMALVSPTTGIVSPRRLHANLAFMGLFGAALLYGDGIITPAISVLSAVEGIKVVTPVLEPLVVPITCMLLVGLFMIQRRGTARVGALFGPAMVLWFASLALAGLPAIFRRPDVLLALDPSRAVRFFAHNGLHGFLVLGAVVLCVTGGEALYADMGHFGRHAIRRAWYFVAMPALVINYFGQGAILLENPANASNPFFALTPGPLIYPMLAIATVATIIASQALISGAFSITQQAMQMGYSPRMTIVHTSERERGQIYIPTVNWMLMIACLWLVLSFKHSSGLAAAYGISVTGTMAITSVLFYAAARARWGWGKWEAGLLVGVFLIVDLAFLGANLTKIAAGGWVPLVVAAAVFTVMTTWRRGRLILGERLAATTLPLKLFLADVERTGPYRVPGTAIFMTSTRRGTPGVLLHHFKHNKVLHEKVVILTIVTDDVPKVEKRHRIHFREFGPSFWAVTAHYGFMQTPRISEILRLCRQLGLDLREEQCSFYLGRESLVPGRVRAMSGWRRRLFAFLSKNARPPTDFFGLPPNRVLELGMQIEL